LPEAAATEKPSPGREVDGRSIRDTERGRQTVADNTRREQGRAMRRKLMGEAFAAKVDKAVYNDPIMEKFFEVTQETIFGTLWTRPGLDLKTRTLICVISDTATGRTPELKLHLRFARGQGWTEDELVEALLHLIGYVGAPLVREAILAARETFAEMRAED
jgi:4-carboxymuconolactone decarboxylase